MEKSDLYAFMHENSHAVLATVSSSHFPEAALVEIAVTPDLEIIFDTVDSTRKCVNLRQNPHIAFVLGPKGPETLQYEGVADEPHGEELDHLKKIYFDACPSGTSREGWPGLTYFRVKPRWIRLSNYYRPRSIREMEFPAPVADNHRQAKQVSFPFSLFVRR